MDTQHANHQQDIEITPQRKASALGVHLLTASTAVIALYTIYLIQQQQFVLAFMLMGIAIFIDAIDGTLARRLHVKKIWPNIDGAMLDNIVDYMNYVLTPCYLLLMAPGLLPSNTGHLVLAAVLISSAFQFVQTNAKTDDNFFLGFPCYWNFVAFYIFLFQLPSWINASLLLALSVMVFVPIKYIYPSRMTHLSHSKAVRWGIYIGAYIFGAANLYQLYFYPERNNIAIAVMLTYMLIYSGGSIYRTLYPLKPLDSQ